MLSKPISRVRFLAGAASVSALPLIGIARAAAGAILTRPIPKTGEQLPMMGLGTSSSFRSADIQARRDVIAALIDGGASLIDTAPSYGDAEQATGDVVAELGQRGKVFLATKVAENGADVGRASIENSFKVLKADVIDLMQVHNLVDTGTQLATIREMKAAGRIRYSGVTHWRPDTQEALAEVMATDDVDFVQLNYSVDVRQPENRLLPMAQDKGIAVLINVPLGRGRLLETVKGRAVPQWAQDIGCETFAQMLLNFVLSHPAVTCAIPATSKVKHIADNLTAARGRLPDAKERARIAEFWADA